MKNKMILIIALTFMVTSCSPDCSDNKSSYNDGYTHGEIASYGSYQSCSSYVDAMADEGIYLSGNSCFCAGFHDGEDGKENRYKED